MHYWTGALGKNSSTLKSFVGLVEGSPVMMPFNATDDTGSPSLIALLGQSPTVSFPPPLACHPGLSSAQLQLLNSLETSVFGLISAPGASTFDTSCFPNRPVYGVLDILQLRLPFNDGRTGVAKQAVVLTRDAYSRAVVYSGEAVSALPGPSSSSLLSTDPREYGTMNTLSHVIFKYLRSLDVSTASALVDFVLGSPAVPPEGSVLSALSSLPTLEVAVFGSITTSDVSSVASALSNATGGLFFGTQDSAIMRNWTLGASHPMVWTSNATSPKVVRDRSFDNNLFNNIWENASKFFNEVSQSIVTESNITVAFDVEGLYTS